jgi:signal transduction histidine kinase
MADRDKLVQVLMNLVSNALKYSPPAAPVRVVARATPGYAEISVVDQGIGLSPGECARVFDKFVRAARPEVREVNGTGLGLYIAKNLVEMQQGLISVRSEPGRGSVFSVSLPLAPKDTLAGAADNGVGRVPG